MGFESGAGGAGGGGSVATDVMWNAKGDLAVATADNTAVRLPVGSNTQVLTADSTQTSGVKWAAAAGGGSSPALVVPVGDWVIVPAVTLGTVTPVDGDLRLTRLPVWAAMTVDRLIVDVTGAASAGGVARYVLYKDADGDGVPDTLVVDGGTFSVTGTGATGVLFGSPPVLAVGGLWAGVVNQGGAATPATYRSVTGMVEQLQTDMTGSLANLVHCWQVTGVTGAAAASITPTLVSLAAPRWGVHRSA